MTRKLLIFATFVCFGGLSFSAVAEQVTAADLAKEANTTDMSADPVADFKGPDALLKAAKQGDASAQLDIAILYEYGFHMPDNKVYALAWYILAAENSAKAAAHRDKLMSELSASEVERAKAMSKKLVKEIPRQAPQAPPSAPTMPKQEPASPDSSPTGNMPPPSEPMPMPIPDEAPK